MQISSRFGAVFAASALAASVVLGGAGVANAQGSLDSLTGSLSSSDVEVTVAGGEDGVAGEVANNTDVPLADCTVHYSDADSMELVEAALDGGAADLAEALESIPDGELNEEVEVGAVEATTPWNGNDDDGYDPEETGDLGAVVECGDDDATVTAFGYEGGGPLGSVDMGSLDMGSMDMESMDS